MNDFAIPRYFGIGGGLINSNFLYCTFKVGHYRISTIALEGSYNSPMEMVLNINSAIDGMDWKSREIKRDLQLSCMSFKNYVKDITRYPPYFINMLFSSGVDMVKVRHGEIIKSSYTQ